MGVVPAVWGGLLDVQRASERQRHPSAAWGQYQVEGAGSGVVYAVAGETVDLPGDVSVRFDEWVYMDSWSDEQVAEVAKQMATPKSGDRWSFHVAGAGGKPKPVTVSVSVGDDAIVLGYDMGPGGPVERRGGQ